jgi:serine/threonine protein kinase
LNDRDSDVEIDFKETEHYLNSLADPVRKEEATRRVISFKDFKGFKRLGAQREGELKKEDIHDHYKFYKVLGKGSFGEVLLASHIKAKVPCAVKVVRKKSIEKQPILVSLMKGELHVLEEVVSANKISPKIITSLQNIVTPTHHEGL